MGADESGHTGHDPAGEKRHFRSRNGAGSGAGQSHEAYPAHEFTICYHAEATEGQTLDLHWELLEGGVLQVDAYKKNGENTANPSRAFSVQVLY